MRRTVPSQCMSLCTYMRLHKRRPKRARCVHALTCILPVVQEGQHDLEAGAARLVQDMVQRFPRILILLARAILHKQKAVLSPQGPQKSTAFPTLLSRVTLCHDDGQLHWLTFQDTRCTTAACLGPSIYSESRHLTNQKNEARGCQQPPMLSAGVI